METFFIMVANFWRAILDKLDLVQFNIAGFDVSLYSILLAFLVMAMIIGLFWRGVRA